MSYYECPYCKKDAGSFLIFCGPFILSGLERKCPNCSSDIKINLLSFFSFYFAIILVFFLSGILLPLIFKISTSSAILGAALLLLPGQFFVTGILNKTLGTKLFIKNRKGLIT